MPDGSEFGTIGVTRCCSVPVLTSFDGTVKKQYVSGKNILQKCSEKDAIGILGECPELLPFANNNLRKKIPIVRVALEKANEDEKYWVWMHVEDDEVGILRAEMSAEVRFLLHGTKENDARHLSRRLSLALYDHCRELSLPAVNGYNTNEDDFRKKAECAIREGAEETRKFLKSIGFYPQ